mgnify:FL=1
MARELKVGDRVKITCSIRRQWNIAAVTYFDGLTGTVTEVRPLAPGPWRAPYLVKFDPHERVFQGRHSGPVEESHFEAKDLEILAP